MNFQLKPAVRQLSLAFPLLLIALPAVLKAADDKPGVALPPPSLYDSPGQTATPPSTPSAITRPTPPVNQPAPVQAAPERAPAAQAKPLPQATPTTARTAPAADHPTVASEPARQPWYKRWFSSSSEQPAQKPATTADAGRATGSLSTGERPQYAFDSPSRAIRTGYGQCVRTGWWTPVAGAADCEPDLQRQQAAVKQPAAVAQASPRRTAGSAPAREIIAAKSDPVEVVPLPVREEIKPAPKEQVVREEIITALAATRPIAEPDYEKLTLSAGALFALSSTSIKPLGREKLDELVARLKELDFESVRVVGHSDPTGPAAMNERLSKRRAESVKQYLVSHGIDAKRIQTEGKGGAQPLPKTRDCDALPRMDKIICYAPDRRVEIQVVGGKPRS
jgi:OOP family OmpA-OmpF porin